MGIKTLAIRALSDIQRSASLRVSYLIKHSCSYFKYYIQPIKSNFDKLKLIPLSRLRS